jgi:tetrahydromethanopterin S-methyltransferase subunit G
MTHAIIPPDEPESPVLRCLRSIDERFDNIERKLDEVVTRVSSLGEHFAGFQRELAAVNVRLDNLDRRVGRISASLSSSRRSTP